MNDIVCVCGDERNRHYSERASSGDPLNPASREPAYYACLVVHCDCKLFKPKSGDKKNGG